MVPEAVRYHSRMTPLPVTLLVITHNEAASIGRCLDSAPFAAEKVVVDSGSDDDTVAIARARGARVVHQEWLGFGAQRNFATTQASNDWIVVLDADEYFSAPAIEAMWRLLPPLLEGDAAVAILRRRTQYMGAPMRWYRPMTGERKARVYHRDRARWSDVRVHESLRWEGRAEALAVTFEHAFNPTLVHNELKSLRYAELKCRDWIDRGRPARPWMAPVVYFATLAKELVLRRAMLDGWRGLAAAHVASTYAAYKRLRHYEMVVNPESVELARDALLRHGLDR